MRRWLDAVVGTLLVLLVVVGGTRWVDTTWRPVIVLQSLGPFVVIGLGLLTVGTVLLRRWWMLLPVAACAVAAWGMALPTFFAHTVPGQANLTVMAANLDQGRANADQVMAAVRAHDVDVLVLTEATPEVIDRLDAAGLTRLLGNRTGQARPDTFTGTTVYSRVPMAVVAGTADPAVEGTASLQPEVVLTVDGRPVRLKAAHPMAPLPGTTEQWRAALSALNRWKQNVPAGDRLVLAGVFNASFGHPAFRRLADGLVDAQRAAGLGWVRTWPVVGRRWPPFVALDHVLSRGLSVVDAGQVAFHGSDHFLVWAKYALE
ncbi:MAG: endonuclease/exonuclease/phosphatase family protein [Intrasporangium sp.]|uniref:endonuclease/exonuclease/phosphatase family protein n=1 Tax=Intrasporangium sp. TaxID=1925024 RepID=UPI002647F88A|nr:endonuclease/exonuclease/phosphatase family protein [Intrasporangium sp.]MDN5794247.1 endonuclease/exonuclease/phosphatase family protein [Intrasporangium sp.]